MSFAMRNDGTSFRSVDGPDKQSEEFPNGIAEDEVYSLEMPTLVQALPTPVEILASVNTQRDSLLSAAALRIAPLQDAIDLGTATDTDVANLKLWKSYRVAVNRVPGQVGFPATIDWPTPPV